MHTLAHALQLSAHSRAPMRGRPGPQTCLGQPWGGSSRYKISSWLALSAADKNVLSQNPMHNAVIEQFAAGAVSYHQAVKGSKNVIMQQA